MAVSRIELAEALAGPGSQRAQIEQPDPSLLDNEIKQEPEGGPRLKSDGTFDPPVKDHPFGRVPIFRRSERQVRPQESVGRRYIKNSHPTTPPMS